MLVMISVVGFGVYLTWAFIHSSSLAGRQYDELARKKFFGEEGGDEQY